MENKNGIFGKVLMIGGGILVTALGAIGLYKAKKAKQEAEEDPTYIELESGETDVDEVEATNE